MRGLGLSGECAMSGGGLVDIRGGRGVGNNGLGRFSAAVVFGATHGLGEVGVAGGDSGALRLFKRLEYMGPDDKGFTGGLARLLGILE